MQEARHNIRGFIRQRVYLTKEQAKPARRYDVVCANLISTLLIAERKRIVARVKPGGILIVAGILKIEFHLVQSAFESLGLRLVASKREKEWGSGTFVTFASSRRS